MVAAAGAPGSTIRGPAIDVWLKTWYLSPAFLLHDTYQGGHYGQHYYGRQDKVLQENIP
jgi:hypothetical protein